MNLRSSLALLIPLLALATLAAFALGCVTETPAGPFRTTMAAPDLEYIPPAKIKTTMWVLAAEIKHLERLIDESSSADIHAKRPMVVASLERMRLAARNLDQPGRSSQHPIINQHLERFVRRLERARIAAERNPPNFFPASTVAGSCFVCHGENSATVFPPAKDAYSS
ncbi:MAG: hypothetical protein AB8G23_07300 [Myxococcota bacterium]